MFNTKLKKLSAVMLFGASLTLTGCDLFEGDDDSPSDNVVQVAGDALKGVLANADVNLYHNSDITDSVLSTTTDENGDYVLQGALDDGGIYLITITANEDTTMVCDAVNCGTEEMPIAFGETVPSESLAGLQLSNVTFVNHSDLAVAVEAQVNAVTTVATELLVLNLNDTNADITTVDADGFANMQTAVSKTVAAVFGVDVGSDTNVFTLTLPDLTNAEESAAATGAASGFGVINAAMTTSGSDNISSSVNNIIEGATTLASLDSGDADYQEAADAWTALQDVVLADAVEIIAVPGVEVPAEVATEISDADNNGIDLVEIGEAIDKAEEIVEGGGETGGETGGA